jgi:hypothetical protein
MIDGVCMMRSPQWLGPIMDASSLECEWHEAFSLCDCCSLFPKAPLCPSTCGCCPNAVCKNLLAPKVGRQWKAWQWGDMAGMNGRCGDMVGCGPPRRTRTGRGCGGVRATGLGWKCRRSHAHRWSGLEFKTLRMVRLLLRHAGKHLGDAPLKMESMKTSGTIQSGCPHAHASASAVRQWYTNVNAASSGRDDLNNMSPPICPTPLQIASLP